MRNELLYDKDFRKKIAKNPKAVFKEMKNEFSLDNLDIKVVTNNKNITYVVIPVESAMNVDLNAIMAAGTAGTAGTASSAGSVSTITSTVGSISSGATAGTAGSLTS